MSDRKTSKEIQAEIDALTDQLAATLRLEIDELNQKVLQGEDKYQALLKRMIGQRILITKKGDELYGLEAVITKPHDKSKKPMYWWFRTTTGIKAYKAKTSFQLLPLDSKAPSKSK